MTSAYYQRMQRIAERNRKMRELYQSGGWTLRRLAKRYRMSFQRVGIIVKETA